jgi:hypothetical protein
MVNTRRAIYAESMKNNSDRTALERQAKLSLGARRPILLGVLPSGPVPRVTSRYSRDSVGHYPRLYVVAGRRSACYQVLSRFGQPRPGMIGDLSAESWKVHYIGLGHSLERIPRFAPGC